MALTPEERRRRFQAAREQRGQDAYQHRQDTGQQRQRRTAGRETRNSSSAQRGDGYQTRQRSRAQSRNSKEIDLSGESFLLERRNEQRRIRAERRRKQVQRQRIVTAIVLVLAVILLIFAARAIGSIFFGDKGGETAETAAETTGGENESSAAETEASTEDERAVKLAEAERLAAMYDYDGAIELLSALPGADTDSEISSLIAGYEETKSKLVRQDINAITHVFFHSLIVDPENALDKERWGTQAEGYNSVMTTISEFEKMLDEFYRDGFVLVGLHDMAHMEASEDGTEVMVAGDIMLPEGKKAMVMSQDDVCYYEYMEGAGFADRILIGEDGKTTCRYVDEEGVEHFGEYDLVPILNRFVEEHPDFSYKGAKACLAFTGYNGILGYRTDETYDPNSDMYDEEKEPNYNIEEDRQTAREVAAALVEEGYELASHSWGHRDMNARSLEDMKRDADRWDKNVNQELLGGTCDIILYPFGADVGDWHAYTHDNQKFDYLWDLGFRYFCNVDSSQYWVQLGKDYLRQGRRNLDGYMMWMDLSGQRDKLSDLFDDVGAIFDPARPTPVTQ